MHVFEIKKNIVAVVVRITTQLVVTDGKRKKKGCLPGDSFARLVALNLLERVEVCWHVEK